MKILLIGNYIPDKQESMRRFADMLERGLSERGHQVRRAVPQARVGNWLTTQGTAQKWLGYVDKFVLFKNALREYTRWAEVVHVCDHSNALYLDKSKRTPTVVTCHDLLAVRGALGEETDCPASATGKILQRWILTGVRQAGTAACVSTFTMGDLKRLLGTDEGPRIRLVLNGINHGYRVLSMTETLNRLQKIEQLDLRRPFILHVGSAQPRKNRECVIRTFSRIHSQWNGQVVFAGQPLSAAQLEMVRQLNLKDRIINVIGPDNDTLEALYNSAHALFFPSRFEGFGWPIVEAQACGCPVICSDRCSLPEVAGDAAMIRNVDDEAGFGNDVLELCDPAARQAWVARGLENTSRFTAERMIDEYVKIYEEAAGRNA